MSLSQFAANLERINVKIRKDLVKVCYYLAQGGGVALLLLQMKSPLSTGPSKVLFIAVQCGCFCFCCYCHCCFL